MGGRGEELNADAYATRADITEENDAAFLFFLGFGMDEDEHCAMVHFMLEHQQAAVLVDHQGFANFAEFAALVAATLSLKAHFVELALAAARVGLEYFGHGVMMRRERSAVNCPDGQVFRGWHGGSAFEKRLPCARGMLALE
jgi:hypothetical protein